MYMLIQNQLATMWELKNCYDLDEALKLYALMEMRNDIERQKSDEIAAKYHK